MCFSPRSLLLTPLLVLLIVIFAQATPHTPLAWQQVVEQHPNRVFVGQHKHLRWVRDQNQNFIDDEIERRFHRGDLVDIILELNHCLSEEEISARFARYGQIAYVGKAVGVVYMNKVEFDQLHALAASPDVAMVEWQAPNNPEVDIASRAIQAHKSLTYAGNSAEDLSIDGTGVTIAFIGTGISDSTNSSNGFSQLTGKWVAGFDAGNLNDPGDGSTDPPDVLSFHESIMAAITVGAADTASIACRTPNDGSGGANCAGIASGAKYVNVRQCIPNGNPLCPGWTYPIAVDWVAAHATKFGIRIVNMSFTSCGSDDGTSAMSEEANYLAALGLVVVASMSKAPDACTPVSTIGEQLVKAPGAASFALTVNASDDKGSVSRSDDTIWSNFVIGPRSDFATNQQVLALKPDVAAPGQNLTVYQTGTTVFTGVSGTSPATAIVSGTAALLLQKYPAMTPDSLKQLLVTTADGSRGTLPFFTAGGRTWDQALGWGIVNVGGALQAAAARSTDLTFPSCKSGAAVGSPCLLTTGGPSWLNFDIQTTTPPQVNVQTTIQVSVVNRGTNPASNVLVNFGVYEFASGNPVFHHIGTQVVPQIAAGQSVPVSQAWTPVASNHQCIQVSIAYGLDSDYTNNMTQRNFTVAPSIFHARIENPFFVPATYEVNLHSNRPGWRCAASQSTFRLGPFDCPLDLRINFAAPPHTPPGARGQCDVAIYATPQGGERRLLGGVTVGTYVPKPCLVYGQVFDPHGNVVAGARVSFAQVGHREEAAAANPASQESAAARGRMSVNTNAKGVFVVEITPDVVQRMRVEKPGVGTGELLLRPGCGLSLAGIVLFTHQIEVRPVPPRIVQANAAETK